MAREFIEVAAVTDVGNVRQYNEDSIAIDVENGILALADGMGGHRAGEVASRMATELLVADLAAAMAGMRPDAGPRETMLAVERSINRANETIFAAGRADSKYGGMGTTLALAVFRDDRATWAHVGDSRVYRVRGPRMKLLTRDDSLLRDQVELGVISAEEASRSHNRSLVTRALGIGETVVPHLADDAAVPGDIYMLCSDGLNDLVEDTDIELIVGALRANLPLAAQHLVQAAKDNGGFDNVSVILARIRKPDAAAERRGRIARRVARLVAWLTGRAE